MNFINVCMVAICIGFLIFCVGDVIDFFRHKDECTEEGAVKFNNKNYKFEDRRWVTSERETIKIMANIMGHLILALYKKGVINEAVKNECGLNLLDEIGVNGGVILEREEEENE